MKRTIEIISESEDARELKELLQEIETKNQGEIGLEVKKMREGNRSMAPEVLAALVTGGASILTTLITSIVTLYKSKDKDKGKKIVVMYKNNRKKTQISMDSDRETIQQVVESQGDEVRLIVIEG